jgi:hypothetical protein
VWPRTTSENSYADSDIKNKINTLADLPNGTPGLSPGLCDALDGGGDIFVEHMGVTERALDVAVVHRLLDELEIATVAQQLGAKVVAVVMEAEILHT